VLVAVRVAVRATVGVRVAVGVSEALQARMLTSSMRKVVGTLPSMVAWKEAKKPWPA